MSEERYDAVSMHAQQEAEMVGALTAAAVSRLRAADLGDPKDYPLRLSWCATQFGILIQTEHGEHIVQPDGPIQPGDILRRLIRPEFNRGLAGSC